LSDCEMKNKKKQALRLRCCIMTLGTPHADQRS